MCRKVMPEGMNNYLLSYSSYFYSIMENVLKATRGIFIPFFSFKQKFN
jgi:hypothetical protein